MIDHLFVQVEQSVCRIQFGAFLLQGTKLFKISVNKRDHFVNVVSMVEVTKCTHVDEEKREMINVGLGKTFRV